MTIVNNALVSGNTEFQIEIVDAKIRHPNSNPYSDSEPMIGQQKVTKVTIVDDDGEYRSTL